MKIGIDIDEVVVEFVRGYLKLYNQKYNKNIKFEDIFTYSLWKPLGRSKEEVFELADEYYLSESFDKIELVQGAKEGIKELNSISEAVFITSRPNIIKEKTKTFLKQVFPDPNLKIIHSSNSYSQTNGKTKSEICKNQKIDILIEDDINYALDCADNGIKVILLDKPWNQEKEHKNIIRVKDWDEILEKINELKKINGWENEQ